MKLVQYSDNILKSPIPVKESVSSDDLKALDEMMSTMKSSNGIGLAANQAGVHLRAFVMGTEELGYYKLINPVIIRTSESTVFMEEGCLSFPSLRIKIKRPTDVFVEYMDENMQQHRRFFNGILARVVQHEIDHLDGITFDTKISKIKLKEILRKQNLYNMRLL